MGYFYSSLLPKESTVSNFVGGMRQREVGLRIFNLRLCERHKLPKREME
jgi:hypothetical protein